MPDYEYLNLKSEIYTSSIIISEVPNNINLKSLVKQNVDIASVLNTSINTISLLELEEV